MLDGEQDGEMKRQFSKKQRKSVRVKRCSVSLTCRCLQILAGKGTRQDFVDFYGKDVCARICHACS